jgi:PTS system ascorbate-specific IIC component
MAVLNIIQEILSTPAVLVALIALIGLLLQKKPAADTIRGTIKSFLGFIVLSAGADVIVTSLAPLGGMFQEAFHTAGVVPNNEAIIAVALKEYGQVTALIMFFGMFANILIARITRFKYVFLTGHHTLYMACMIGVILITIGMSTAATVVVGAVALGIVMVLFPALAQPTMKKITKSDDVAFGHFSTIGYWSSAMIGKLVGKNSKSTEEIEFPKSLAFLRDSSVSISLTMVIFYLILALFCGPDYVKNNWSDGTNYIMFSITKGIQFAAGVFIILQGVRLILAEIVPAFKGISERLIPNAKPALDCPIVYTFAPNAVLIGFFSSFVGGIVGMIVLILTGGIIILPGVVPHFFCGATAGVFGNANGGVKGAVFGSFINGLMLTFAPLLLMPLLGDLGYQGTTFSDLDFIASGFLIGKAGQLGPIAATIFVFGVLAVMIAVSIKKPGRKESES